MQADQETLSSEMALSLDPLQKAKHVLSQTSYNVTWD